MKALIFDVDGTLAETERDGHRVAFNAAFAEMGLGWYWDEVTYGQLLSVTGGKERLRYYVRHYLRGEPDERVARLHAAKTAHYLRIVQAGRVPLRPGVAELLAEARHAGVRLAIATTTTLDNVTALLTATLGAEAAGWFEVIGAGDIVAAKKPAPDIYHWVLERLQLPAKACLAIEDSAPGLKAGLGAGIATVITVSDYSRTHDFSGARAVLPGLDGVSLEQLRQLTG